MNRSAGGEEPSLNLETATRPASQPETGRASLEVPGLTVLWHPDVSRVGERVALAGLERRPIGLSRLEPLFAQPRQATRRPLADAHLSRRPIVLRRDGDGFVIERGEVTTPVVVDGEPLVEPRRLGRDAEAVIELGGRVVVLFHRLDPTPAPRPPNVDLVGENAAVARSVEDLAAVADLDVPVLLLGETGTGKERLASSLHAASGRRGPFVAVNLAAVPAALAAVELFGSTRGAYTGAERARRGHCLRAAGGTLFLDEIGEASHEVQAMLLRALETGRILPVGGDAEVAVDVRWIAATDVPLEAAIASGRLRAPLVHRLSGFVLELPPLRRRVDDLGRLFLHFLRLELARLSEASRLDGEEAGAWVPAALIGRLARLPWPGNVRQLQNVVRQLAVSSRGRSELRVPETVARLWRRDAGSALDPSPASADERSGEPSDEDVRRALEAEGWSVQRAATALGLSRAALYRRIAAHPDLRTAADLGDDEVRAALDRHGGALAGAAAELEVSRAALARRLRELERSGG